MLVVMRGRKLERSDGDYCFLIGFLLARWFGLVLALGVSRGISIAFLISIMIDAMASIIFHIENLILSN